MPYRGMYFDSTYLLVILGLILGLAAQGLVRYAYRKYTGVRSEKGVTAAVAVADMLSRCGNDTVQVQPVAGEMTDNYNPGNNTLNLSQNVYGSDSVAALGIAAHEAGHAMQKYDAYALLNLRSMLVPAVNFGSQASMPLFFLGLVASLDPLVTLGIACFALTVLFSLLTLPVEIDASRRGLRMLRESGYLNAEELSGARKVLIAAALTYVASALAALLNLVRLLLIAQSRSSRRRS